MDKRKNNRPKPAGSGPFGALRLRIEALAIGGHDTITVADSGAADRKQLFNWLAGVRAPLKRAGISITQMSVGDGYYVRRLT